MKVKELFEVLSPIMDPVIRVYDYTTDKTIEFRFSEREKEPFTNFQDRSIRLNSMVSGTDALDIDYIDLVVE